MFRKYGFRRAKRIQTDQHTTRSVKRPDVEVPEVWDLAVDSKYQRDGWAHHTKFVNEVEKYVGTTRIGEDRHYRWAIMPTRSGGDDSIFVTLRLEHLLELLQKVFLRNLDGGWSCPRCPGRLGADGLIAGLAVYRYVCGNCALVVLSPETEGEAPAPPLPSASERRGAIIKDRSNDETFKPQLGQLSLRELKAKKQPPKRAGKRAVRGSDRR